MPEIPTTEQNLFKLVYYKNVEYRNVEPSTPSVADPMIDCLLSIKSCTGPRAARLPMHDSRKKSPTRGQLSTPIRACFT